MNVFLNKADLDVPIVRHATEVDYARHKSGTLHSDITFDSDVFDMSPHCLPRLFSSFYLIKEVGT